MMITRTRVLVAALVAMTAGTAAHAQQPVSKPKPKAAMPAVAHETARHAAPPAAPQMHNDTATHSRASQRRKHSAPAAPAKP